MPSKAFLGRHFSVRPTEDGGVELHFRGTDFAEALPADDDPGWEPHQDGRRIRVHGPFLVGDLECNDGWLVVGNDGALSVEEAS